MLILKEDKDKDNNIDTSYDLTTSNHKDSIRLDAIKVMHSYFHGKSYWAGGVIPKNKLYCEEHVQAVMEMSVMDAFAIAYYLLDKNPPDDINIESDEWDIEFCYEAFKTIKKNVPKSNQGGILLVYLAICHGIDFIPTLKRITEIRAIITQWEKEEAEQAAKEEALEAGFDDDVGDEFDGSEEGK